MENCLFCQISSGQISTELIYEDEFVVAFNDIHAKAPVHILIVPKKHIASVDELNIEDSLLVGKMVMTAKKLAQDKNISQDGYRLVLNTRSHAGQTVDHIHLHLLGGKKLGPMA